MVYADGMLIKVVFSSGFTIMKGNRMKTMVLLRFLQLVLCFATGASFWKQYGAYAGRVSCSLQSMARSRTHEKSLARIVRLKEKEKKINRYKTHYGKEYKTYLKAKNDGSAMMPTVRNLTKRKLELQRSLKEMEQMIQFRTIATPTIDEIARDGSYDLFSNITFAATRKKIDYVSALYIGHISSIGDFLIIIEGNNKPHIQAIADEITKGTKSLGFDVPSVQGKAASGWILIDYGKVIVNIMSPVMRNFYKLESRWKDGVELAVEASVDDQREIILPEQLNIETTGIDLSDPFWS